jgi:hypothetical protein
MSCPTLDVLGAYCQNELAETDAASFEEHYFGCDRCAALLERMQALVDRISTLIPHVLTPERRRRLEATGAPIVQERLEPGGSGTITFPRGTELGFWVMRAPLSQAQRVDFELKTSDGARVIALSDVPFDRERQEVVLACRSAYRDLHESTELHASIRVTDASDTSSVSEYFLDHVFDSP